MLKRGRKNKRKGKKETNLSKECKNVIEGMTGEKTGDGLSERRQGL